MTDRAFQNGAMNDVKEWCKRLRDMGTMVGVGTHKPEVIATVEEQGWDVDFYAGCVYNRTRTAEEWKKVLGGELVEMQGECYLQSDPARMYKVMRSTRKPCFAFKIMAAGRVANADQAFRNAYESIKPTDGVFIGLFPRREGRSSRERRARAPPSPRGLTRRFGIVMQTERITLRRRTLLGAGLSAVAGSVISCSAEQNPRLVAFSHSCRSPDPGSGLRATHPRGSRPRRQRGRRRQLHRHSIEQVASASISGPTGRASPASTRLAASQFGQAVRRVVVRAADRSAEGRREELQAVLRPAPGPHPPGILRRSAPRRQPPHGQLENGRAAVSRRCAAASTTMSRKQGNHGASTCQCGDRRRRRRRRRGGQGTRHGRSERRPARTRPVVFGRRLPQRRPLQPAHPGAGREVRPRRRAQPARGGRRAGARDRSSLLSTRATATTRPASAAAPSATAPRRGATWKRTSACALPTARWRAARSKTGPSITPTSNPTTKKPSGRWAFPATIPTTPSRRRAASPLPMPPLPPGREHQILWPAAERLGLHPFHIPMLRNSVPYNGRRSCMRCRWCVGFACEVNARTGTHNTVIPTALATGNCELRTACMTREILLDDRGRATGVAYYDAHDRLQQQTADLVIVCGGAVESARLLLNSRHRLFPAGLGNRYDWVGQEPAGPFLHRRQRSVRLRHSTTTWGPEPPSPFPITTTATPDWWAAPCWPTSLSGCPTSS